MIKNQNFSKNCLIFSTPPFRRPCDLSVSRVITLQGVDSRAIILKCHLWLRFLPAIDPVTCFSSRNPCSTWQSAKHQPGLRLFGVICGCFFVSPQCLISWMQIKLPCYGHFLAIIATLLSIDARRFLPCKINWASGKTNWWTFSNICVKI